MEPQVRITCVKDILPLRNHFRAEMNCQITKDSLHRREGWARSYLLEVDGASVGFGSVAIAGPWKNKPTVFEFYILPAHRSRTFELFESFLAASGASFFEVQTNEPIWTAMALAYGRDFSSQAIVFQDGATTTLAAKGAALRRVTPEEKIRECQEQRQGGGEWVLESDGREVAKGGILFHYNRPYGDIYYEVAEASRRRGFGGYMVQELKKTCYELGAIPCARCSPANVASRRTLQRAGFVPVAHILTGRLVAATAEVQS